MAHPAEILIGRLAVQRGFITQRDLDLALEAQSKGGGKPPLGELLIARGLLSRVQLEQIVAAQKKNLQAPSPYSPKRTIADDLLGRHALAEGWITQDQLRQCLQKQAASQRSGEPRRLGEVLVASGHLTEEQVRALLARQGKRMFRCTKCAAQFNVHGQVKEAVLKCRLCGASLAEIPAPTGGPSAAGTKAPSQPVPSPQREPRKVGAHGTWYGKIDTFEDLLPKEPPPPRVAFPGEIPVAPDATYLPYRRRQQVARPLTPWRAIGALAVLAVLGLLLVKLSRGGAPPAPPPAVAAAPVAASDTPSSPVPDSPAPPPTSRPAPQEKGGSPEEPPAPSPPSATEEPTLPAPPVETPATEPPAPAAPPSPTEEPADADEPPAPTDEPPKTGPANPPSSPPPQGPAPADPQPPPSSDAARRWPRPTAKHYVCLEHGIAIVPPAKWKTIPAPKELDPAYQVRETIDLAVEFDAPNPDTENKSIQMKVYAIPKAASAAEAMHIFLRDTGAYEPTGETKVRIGPWEALTFMARAGRGWYRSVTVIHAEGRAAAISISSGEKWAKKKGGLCLQTAKTFLFVSHEEVARIKARSGQAASTDLPAGWKVLNTAHYEIQYDSETEFAQLVGKHLEAIIKEYARRFPMESILDEMSRGGSGGERRFTVKVFKSDDAFRSYAAANGVRGAAAYFSPAQNELVCYKTTDIGKKTTFNVMYHEASHQYLYLYMGTDVAIPTWLDEGVGDYFFGGEFQPDGSFRIKKNAWRLESIREAVRKGEHVPLAKIFRYSQAQFYANSDLCYAEGWAIAYFLWTTKDKTYVGRLDRFYDALKSTGDGEKAFEQAFGDLDMPRFEKDWIAFVEGL